MAKVFFLTATRVKLTWDKDTSWLMSGQVLLFGVNVSSGCCRQFSKSVNPPLPSESPSPTVNDYKYLFGDVVL